MSEENNAFFHNVLYSFYFKSMFQVLLDRINTLTVLKINLSRVGKEDFLGQKFEVDF